jgi:hypothetical protein
MLLTGSVCFPATATASIRDSTHAVQINRILLSKNVKFNSHSSQSRKFGSQSVPSRFETSVYNSFVTEVSILRLHYESVMILQNFGDYLPVDTAPRNFNVTTFVISELLTAVSKSRLWYSCMWRREVGRWVSTIRYNMLHVFWGQWCQ